MTICNPFKEEDEGYVAAEAGQSVADNPYPRGTIRYAHWRQGWQIKRDEQQNQDNEGYHAADAGQSLAQNPHPKGTIRYEQWRLGWQVKHDQMQRSVRLGHQANPKPEAP